MKEIDFKNNKVLIINYLDIDRGEAILQVSIKRNDFCRSLPETEIGKFVSISSPTPTEYVIEHSHQLLDGIYSISYNVFIRKVEPKEYYSKFVKEGYMYIK